MEQLKLTRNEVMDILNVKTSAMKKIEREDKLEARLSDKGYKLIEKKKEGTKNFYVVEKQSNTREIYSNTCEYVFNVKDGEKFAEYFLRRTLNTYRPISKDELSAEIGVSRKTISDWDDKMLELGIITKDGHFYLAVDYDEYDNPHYRVSCEEEYKSYYKCTRAIGKKRELAEKYKKDEIDFETMSLLMDGITINQKAIDGRFVYRLNKYQLAKNSGLLKDVTMMIKEIHIDEDLAKYIFNVDFISA